MGLRARIVAALLATATLTLVVALVALLSPLDRRLRDDEVSTLRDASVAARPTVAEALRHHSPLLPAALALRRGTGAEVAIFEPSGRLAATTEPGDREPFGLARRALAGGRVMSAAGGDTASVALPVRAGPREVAVLAVKPLREARAAGSVVRGALLPAAAVGLFAAALIGAILAGRLASRVVRLRAAALRVAELGPIVEMPPDPGRDEIGDLSRAFVSMQQRLREQEQARRRFVSTASHELRTPLASLRLMLSLMREDLAAAPPDLGAVERQAARADRQAERLAALADDLLELSRIDAGVALRREPVDVGELCRDVIAEFESRADDEGVDVRLRSTSAWAMADPTSVARVVRILLDNALRHAPAAGHVTVEVQRPGTVRVWDDGPGVADDVRDRLFERFTRGGDTADRPGFGLGLAIGRELARRMGGELRLDDAPDGGGARFALALEPASPP